MNNYLLATLVLTQVGLCFVSPGSAHYDDAYEVFENLSAMGFPDAYVMILRHPDTGSMDYVVAFDEPFTGQMIRLLASSLSVAYVSERTDWSSGYLHVQYPNAVYSISTADIRWIANNNEGMTDQELGSYFESHGCIAMLVNDSGSGKGLR